MIQISDYTLSRFNFTFYTFLLQPRVNFLSQKQFIVVFLIYLYHDCDDSVRNDVCYLLKECLSNEDVAICSFIHIKYISCYEVNFGTFNF